MGKTPALHTANPDSMPTFPQAHQECLNSEAGKNPDNNLMCLKINDNNNNNNDGFQIFCSLKASKLNQTDIRNGLIYPYHGAEFICLAIHSKLKLVITLL